jgi:hypothetical protein
VIAHASTPHREGSCEKRPGASSTKTLRALARRRCCVRKPSKPPDFVVRECAIASLLLGRRLAAVYNQFECLEERRAALEAWGRHVKNLLFPVPANVVPLRGS